MSPRQGLTNSYLQPRPTAGLRPAQLPDASAGPTKRNVQCSCPRQGTSPPHPAPTALFSTSSHLSTWLLHPLLPEPQPKATSSSRPPGCHTLYPVPEGFRWPVFKTRPESAHVSLPALAGPGPSQRGLQLRHDACCPPCTRTVCSQHSSQSSLLKRQARSFPSSAQNPQMALISL